MIILKILWYALIVFALVNLALDVLVEAILRYSVGKEEMNRIYETGLDFIFTSFEEKLSDR